MNRNDIMEDLQAYMDDLEDSLHRALERERMWKEHCRELKAELAILKRKVRVTTDFGSDIVFATVQLIAGEGEVLDWRMDGRPMDVEALTPMQVATLVNIARETEHREELA